MAKALYGHMAAPDQRLIAELLRLRARVRELETQVERLEFERAVSGQTIVLDQELLEPIG